MIVKTEIAKEDEQEAAQETAEIIVITETGVTETEIVVVTAANVTGIVTAIVSEKGEIVTKDGGRGHEVPGVVGRLVEAVGIKRASVRREKRVKQNPPPLKLKRRSKKSHRNTLNKILKSIDPFIFKLHPRPRPY